MIKKFVSSAVGFLTFSFGLTLLFHGMRAVMEVGGACSSGGPYVSAQPCPSGTGYLFVGFVACGLGASLILAGAIPRGPRLLVFTWSSLFGALGWNFLDYGVFSDEQRGGSVGLIICAVLFGLMAGAPLLSAVIDPKRTFWGDDDEVDRTATSVRSGRLRVRVGPDGFTFPTSGPLRGVTVSGPGEVFVPPPDDGGPGPGSGGSAPDDLVENLERLSAMQRSGALTDEEFARAKERLLNGGER